jgi:hypothetical protein
MSDKNQPTGLDRKMFGETIGYWAKLTPEQRLADNRIGKKRIGPLNDAVAAAMGESSVSDAEPSVSTEQAPAASAPVEPAGEPAPAADVGAAGPHVPVVVDTPLVTVPTTPPGQAATTVAIEVVSLDAVVRQLKTAPEPVGHKSRSPMCSLTPAQSTMQARLYAVLTASGVSLRTQGDVYGWLLDQVDEVAR